MRRPRTYEFTSAKHGKFIRTFRKCMVIATMVGAFGAANASNASQFNDLRKTTLAQVPAAEMIVFKASTAKAKHIVHVFTDVDCGYCRRLHQNIAQYSALGIEVRYLWELLKTSFSKSS